MRVKHRPADTGDPIKPAPSSATGQQERLSVEDRSLAISPQSRTVEAKAENERPEADKITGVQLEAAWHTRGPAPPPGIDLTTIFGNGLLQYTTLFFAIVAQFVQVSHNVLPNIIAASVDHWCKQPGEYPNMTSDEWRNFSAPRDANGTWDRCSRFEPPLSVYSQNRTRVSCWEWDYDPERAHTIVAEWNLVCGRRWLLTVGSVLYMAGAMVAAMVAGKASDEMGRRPVICISVLVLLSSGMAICFVTTYPSFLLLRVFVAASVNTVRMTSFVLLFELSTPEFQCLYSVLAVAVGLATAPPFIHLLGSLKVNWILAEAVVMLPTSLLVCAFYVIAESPRWLVSRARYVDVERAMLWAANMNGASVNETKKLWRTMWEALRQAEAEMSAKGKSGLTGILTSPILRRRAFIVCPCWFFVVIAYHGGYRTRRSGSLWLSIASMALKAPSFFLMYRVMTTLGRRYTLCALFFGFSLIFGSAVLLAEFKLFSALAEVMHWLCGVLMDLIVTMTFTYTAELFPTEVRNIALCAAYFFGRLGSMVAPLIFELAWTESLFAMSACGLLVALVVLFLPETMSCGTVDNIKDMDEETRKEILARIEQHLKDTQATAGQAKTAKKSQPKPTAERPLKGDAHH